ncbi:MAG: YqeG family HAD IIIA-type phosphatase, partial [Coriobacteriia bacterium]|nr:YqeG family HAD IIIA-type phosphatase [Coriobacteriia bacterium]
MAFPKYYLDSVLDIDPAWLQKVGRTCVLIDLDNTLLPRDTSTFSSEVREWVQSLYDAGLDVCLLSNNWHQRVFTAADELNMRLVSKAIKPLPFAFLLA